jgi:hypothetical protein
MRRSVEARNLLMFRTPSISFLIRTAAVLKGSTTSPTAASASTATPTSVLPLALAVAIRRRAIVTAGALVVGHWNTEWFFGSLLQGMRRTNMGW